MPKISFNLSVPDPARFGPALAEAKKIGLRVSQSFADLGIASGSIESASVARLRRIEGLNIEEDRAVSIPVKPGRMSGA